MTKAVAQLYVLLKNKKLEFDTAEKGDSRLTVDI